MDAKVGLGERALGLAASLTSVSRGGQVAVLTYHRVLGERDELVPDTPTAGEFREQMRVLAQCFRPLRLADAIDRRRRGVLPRRAVCVTFDDGYLDNFAVAQPILREYGVPATFFIATGYLGGGRMFNDTIIETIRRAPAQPLDLGWLGLGVRSLGNAAERRSVIDAVIGAVKYRTLAERETLAGRLAAQADVRPPANLMMQPDHVRALDAAGMAIGGHTRSHPILAELDAGAAEAEIRSGRDDLVAMLGHPVAEFAYPNGRPGRDYHASHVRMVAEAGFSVAVSTAWGAIDKESDPLQLPRVSPRAGSGFAFAAGLARSYLATVR